MPQRKVVPGLRRLSCVSLCNVIDSIVKQYTSDCEYIHDYIGSSLPVELRHEVLNTYILCHGRHSDTLLRGLSILLDHTTRQLVLPKEHTSIWFEDLQCLYPILLHNDVFGLEKLSLYAGKLISFDIEMLPALNHPLHRVLQNSQNLRQLVLQFIADDVALCIIGQNCSSLQVLDISTSWAVSDFGIKCLCYKDPLDENSPNNPVTKTLLDINIEDTCTSNDGIYLLLYNIPSLKGLKGFVSNCDFGKAIEMVYMNGLANGKVPQLELENIMNTCVSTDEPQVITNCCPKLKSMCVRGDCLLHFQTHTGIQELTLDCNLSDFNMEMSVFLSHQGPFLSKLILLNQTEPIDVDIILNNCFNLVQFVGKLSGNHTHITSKLTRLETAYISSNYPSSVASFLMNIPVVKKVKINMFRPNLSTSAGWLNDDDMQLVFQNNYFQHLEEFEILSENLLSMKTMRYFLGSVPNLKKLGQLRLWKSLREENLQSLQHECKESNWDIEFL